MNKIISNLTDWRFPFDAAPRPFNLLRLKGDPKYRVSTFKNAI